MTPPRTHIRGAVIVLRDRELHRTACGLYVAFEPVTFAEPGELPSCPKCMWLADDARREGRP